MPAFLPTRTTAQGAAGSSSPSSNNSSSSSWDAAAATTASSSIISPIPEDDEAASSPSSPVLPLPASPPEQEEQDLDPLVAEEIRPFRLPAGERVLESYSCALLPNNLLIHGRLYVTPKFACFGSWGATRLVLPMEDISFIEKANTMVGAASMRAWVSPTTDTIDDRGRRLTD